jgi:nitroreductase
MTKTVSTDYPVHEFIASRWSPYAFDEKPVEKEDLLSLFEAARWAPSSYNEQPWHYIVATKDNTEEFERLLSCLVEGNQAWAKSAPVLALGISKINFVYNNKPNRAAIHDLGLAAGSLLFEATARGLYVHQMIGILPERACEIYAIPEGYEVMTGIAIGYVGNPDSLPDNIGERDAARRPRKPLSEFIFSGRWGTISPLVRK